MRRKDAKIVKDPDPFHSIVPYIMPKRTESEVSSRLEIDITEALKFIEKSNKEKGTNYKFFHCVCTVVARMIYHRPKLNIFISGRRYWMRNDITLSFVAKQRFEDEAVETLMTLKIDDDMTLDDISKKILGDVNAARSAGNNSLDATMKFVGSLPRFVLEILFFVLARLEYHGIFPESLKEGDPNYTTCLLANLGSIRANSVYHHLSNYGTNSFMLTIGTIKHNEETGRDTVDFTATLDERIADGFYFAKSLRLAEYLLQNPEKLLERIADPVPDNLFD